MRSKDFAKIFTGGLLILAQVLVLIFDPKAWLGVQVSFDSWIVFMYGCAELLGQYFGAIFGPILLIWGMVAHNKNKA